MSTTYRYQRMTPTEREMHKIRKAAMAAAACPMTDPNQKGQELANELQRSALNRYGNTLTALRTLRQLLSVRKNSKK